MKLTVPSKRTLLIAAAGAALFAGGVVAGRLTKKPVETVRTLETKAEAVMLYAAHAKGQQIDRGRKRTVRVSRKAPDGSVLTTTTVDQVNDLTLNLDWTSGMLVSGSTESKQTEVSRPAQPDWRLGLGVQSRVTSLTKPALVQGEVDRRLFSWPVLIGVRGTYVLDRPKDSTLGVAVSLEK